MRKHALIALFLLGGRLLAAPIQVAVGTGVACLLRQGLWTGGESAVKCWGLGGLHLEAGRELPVPPLNHATAIAASRATACALDAGKVRCWGYAEDYDGQRFAEKVQSAFADFREPLRISGGPQDICAVDRRQGTRCLHEAAYVTSPENSIGGAAAHPPSPLITGAGFRMACTLGADHRPYCWPTEVNGCGTATHLSDEPVLSDPSELAVSPASSNGVCRVCVIDLGDVRCWGAQEPSGVASELRAPTQLTQIDVRLHGGLSVQPCVIDDGQVKCRTVSGAFVPDADYLGFARPVALAGNDMAQCAANEESLLCYYGDGIERHTVRVPHGMWFRPFELADLPATLERAAQSTYVEKATVFRAAAAVLRGDPQRAHFMLHALQPLIDLVDNELFAHFVKPNWDRVRAAEDASRHLSALRDFAGDDGCRWAALILLKTAVPVLRQRMAASPAWDRFLSRLADALATGGDGASLKRLTEVFRPLRFELARLSKTSREWSLAVMVSGLAEVLAP